MQLSDLEHLPSFALWPPCCHTHLLASSPTQSLLVSTQASVSPLPQHCVPLPRDPPPLLPARSECIYLFPLSLSLHVVVVFNLTSHPICNEVCAFQPKCRKLVQKSGKQNIFCVLLIAFPFFPSLCLSFFLNPGSELTCWA